MDSSQLDELGQAYCVCTIRIYDKVIKRSNALIRLSNYLSSVGTGVLIFGVFFAQSITWIPLFLIIVGTLIAYHAAKIRRLLHLPSSQEIIQETEKLADELPDFLGWGERHIGDALTQAIIAGNLVLIRNILIEIECEEDACLLKNWRFLALAREAFV